MRYARAVSETASSGTGDVVELKEQVYVDERPSEYFDRFYDHQLAHDPDWVYTAVRVISVVYARGFFRIRGIDAGNVPATGPIIIAPNHFSHVDHFFAGASLRRKLRFMAKSQLFVRGIQEVYRHGGVVPVRRGQRDSRAMEATRSILDRGGVMTMYCEGGRSRTTDLGEKAKWGIGQIALTTGAPVVPTAILGSSHARNWKKGKFPKVTVKYGQPLWFEQIDEPTKAQSQAAADQIFDEIKTLYYGLREQGRDAALAQQKADRKAAKG